MQLHGYVLEAIDAVLGWELPDEVCSEAITAQIYALAHLDLDQSEVSDLD